MQNTTIQSEFLDKAAKLPVVFFWFRRDLRLQDNAALFAAKQFAEAEGLRIIPVFIFDSRILSNLLDKDDKRVAFIYSAVQNLKEQLQKIKSDILVLHGDPEMVWHELCQQFKIVHVYANKDYEPYAIERDARIRKILAQKGGNLQLFKDQVIFEEDEILNNSGSPYTVFTPYSRKWLDHFSREGLSAYKSENRTELFFTLEPQPMPKPERLGFSFSEFDFPARSIRRSILQNYHETRDIPGIVGTSRLGVHLRFGTLSIRTLVNLAAQENSTFLNELIWREFYMMILWHFPHTVNSSFRESYDNLIWRGESEEFAAWCRGQTGYALVDAGMRELVATGFMHNRVRMLTASFLTKHLLTDWRLGERWFARYLLDFELASNVGGWQWAAGCGTDAAPYFRIFNPNRQLQKFDTQLAYVAKWAPEYVQNPSACPKKIVEHTFARERALNFYKKGLAPKA